MSATRDSSDQARPLELDLFSAPVQMEVVSKRPDPELWTVSQVNRAVRRLLEGSLRPLWVSGEVGGWNRAPSGHCYFTLKDERAQLRCVMWRTEAERLPTDAEDGMEVRAFGALTLYESRGAYQLVVKRLDGAGAEGLWQLAFERLRGRLEAEGLLDPERKRPLPGFPVVVGVVTSVAGAALRDILSVLSRRAPWVRVVIRNTRVQGEGAALEVANALHVLTRRLAVDVVIVGRGGGSIEDLWAFNEEPVARAIAASPVPVISAVGHETDVTIADLVADARASTPSAAAALAVPDRDALLEALRKIEPRLGSALGASVSRRAVRRLRTSEALGAAMTTVIRPRRAAALASDTALTTAVRSALRNSRGRLEMTTGKLEALSPLATLRRGYSVAQDADGHVLRRVADFKPSIPFALRVVDGRVECRSEGARNDGPPTPERA